jgi:hypothetical protein
MNFRVGQKVVCVDDCNGRPGTDLGLGYDNGLRNGSVYTVTKLWTNGGDAYCALAEIEKDGWHAGRFRPAVERKTGISVFTKILDDVSRKVPADAVH